MSQPQGPQLTVEWETTELGDGEVELSVRVPPEQVTPIREQVIAAFARQVTVPGFRPGRAPRALVERQIDQQRLKEEIVEQLLEPAYDQAIDKAGIKVLGRARVSQADIAEDGAFTLKASVTRRPDITLGEYRGLQATRHITRVTDAEVEAELERLRSRYARFVELPEGATLQKGDLALVDYEGLIDGQRVEPACATGYPLELGEDELFPELNDALIGAAVGDVREITVESAPEQFGPEFAGKPVLYRVKVTSARRRQLPELDDEFARQVSGLDTLEALRARIRQNLEAIGRAIAEDSLRNELVRQVCESARLEIPAAFVARAVERRVREIEEDLARRGLSLSTHLQRLGRSYEDWRADLEVEVRDDVRRALILDEIGQRENIEVTDEDIEQEIARLAQQQRVPEDQIRRLLSEPDEFQRLMSRLYHRKVVQFLVDHAQISEEVTDPDPAAAEEASHEGEGETENV